MRKAFKMERAEITGTYPEDRSKQSELWPQQASESDEDKAMEQVGRGVRLLIAAEQEKQSYQEQDGSHVARIKQVHAGTGGYKQDVEGSLHRSTQADDGKRVVQLDEEISDDGIQQETGQAVGPYRQVEVSESAP